MSITSSPSLWEWRKVKSLFLFPQLKRKSNPAYGGLNYSHKELQICPILKKLDKNGQFQMFHIDLDDLNDIEILNHRNNLSKGELSSMVFAKKTQQAFITDDQGARKLASSCIPNDKEQTTPHLFGWLIYRGILGDSDKDAVISEHVRFSRPLEKYFNEIYEKALLYRLAYNSSV
jgi:hypothetical protein